MNVISTTSILRNIKKPFLLPFQLSHQARTYAKKDTGGVSMIGGVLKKKKVGKAGATMEKKVLPVEADPNKLVNFVCGSNIYKTGEDVELKPDSEYPDWLWNLRLGPPPPLEQLEPNSKEYWKRIRKMALRRNNKLAQLRKF